MVNSQSYGYRSRGRSGISTRKSLPAVYSSAEETVLWIGIPEDGIENADFQLSLERGASVN